MRASAAVAESRWKETLEKEKRSPAPQAMEPPPPPIPVTVTVEEEVPEATTPVTESEMLAHPTADTEPVLEAILRDELLKDLVGFERPRCRLGAAGGDAHRDLPVWN